MESCGIIASFRVDYLYILYLNLLLIIVTFGSRIFNVLLICVSSINYTLLIYVAEAENMIKNFKNVNEPVQFTLDTHIIK